MGDDIDDSKNEKDEGGDGMNEDETDVEGFETSSPPQKGQLTLRDGDWS